MYVCIVLMYIYALRIYNIKNEITVVLMYSTYAIPKYVYVYVRISLSTVVLT